MDVFWYNNELAFNIKLSYEEWVKWVEKIIHRQVLFVLCYYYNYFFTFIVILWIFLR